jgi:hypothetical protein
MEVVLESLETNLGIPFSECFQYRRFIFLKEQAKNHTGRISTRWWFRIFFAISCNDMGDFAVTVTLEIFHCLTVLFSALHGVQSTSAFRSPEDFRSID